MSYTWSIIDSTDAPDSPPVAEGTGATLDAAMHEGSRTAWGLFSDPTRVGPGSPAILDVDTLLDGEDYQAVWRLSDESTVALFVTPER